MIVPPPDPDFREKMCFVATMIAAYTNAHVHYDMRDMGEFEIESELGVWMEVMAEMIEELG